jgi:predicted nucleic-acid-binding Zn-ribbon protein
LEPWKKIVCQTEECLQEALDTQGKVRSDYYILPDVDNEVLTQFTCPRCGFIETWGITRRKVAKALYERLVRA